MSKLLSIVPLALLATTDAYAQALDGTYKGERTTTGGKGDIQYCGTIPSSRPASFTVKGDTISGGNWSSKIAPDGTFIMKGTLNNRDQDVMTITGKITGATLQAKWETPGVRATCWGEYTAQRS